MKKRSRARRTKSRRRVREEAPISRPNEERNLDSVTTTSEPLKCEAIEQTDLMEISPFPISTTIDSTNLRRHIRDKVMLHFYTLSGKWSHTRSFGECESVFKLFGQAIAAKAFGCSIEARRKCA